MGFLEEAVNKTKEIFDVACQKTSEVVITEKQKFNAASLKSKREKDYAELGRIYFEMVKDDTEVDTKTRKLVDAIVEKSDEIDRINAEIESIKKKRICPNCGSYADEKSSYCNNCGIKFN